MKEIFKQIWKKAELMQDLRDDKGHAKIVTGFAEKLCNIFKANEMIVTPTAILHDIGYYGMDKNILKNLMVGKLSKEEIKRIKDEHMKKGAELAENILKKLNYNPKFVKIIVNIIKNHDSEGVGFSIEEKIIRDADKLWRYSKEGFDLDVKRRNCKSIEWYNYLLKNLEKENYFQTEEAKKIAIDELKKREKEMPAEKFY